MALCLVCVLNLCGWQSGHGQTNPSRARTFKLIHGQWFDGKKFRRQDIYSVNGLFTRKKPAEIDEVIDLQNGYVVPPFADAHCHNFDSTGNVAQQVNAYLKDGVFYAKVQTDVRSGALKVADAVNRPESVDVSYAHGALTASYGHGIEIYEGLALYYRGGGFSPEETQKVRESHLRDNDAYYIIDSVEDLERKWSKVLEGKPDFIKIYLLTSEEYEQRRKRADTVGDRGLDPKLVPLIVSKAHAAGLRVSAHVDTVTDYRVALNAGVDEMAHMPGYYLDVNDNPLSYELTPEDARQSARRRVWIDVAPVAYDIFNQQSPSFNAQIKERTDAVRVHNLRLLKRYKAKIAFASDRYGSTPVNDVLYLQKLGVFSNLEMLKIWVEDTPQSIFPKRRIGHLREGYEASFLVLAGNPLEDFTQVQNIKLRFKQGHQIILASPAMRNERHPQPSKDFILIRYDARSLYVGRPCTKSKKVDARSYIRTESGSDRVAAVKDFIRKSSSHTRLDQSLPLPVLIRLVARRFLCKAIWELHFLN